MKFSENWLRTFANPPLDTEELARALTFAGLEVEEIEPVAPAFDRVVVGEVVSVEKHPGADRLSVCQVNIGVAPLTIVCGAPNVRPGIKVPTALVGAKLPPWLIQSLAGRSRIHQCCEPMWLSTMSITRPMPRAFASRDNARTSSLRPIRASVL